MKSHIVWFRQRARLKKKGKRRKQKKDGIFDICSERRSGIFGLMSFGSFSI